MFNFGVVENRCHVYHSGLLQMPPEVNINVSLYAKEKERERRERKKKREGRRDGRGEKINIFASIKISYSQSIINSKYRTLNLTIVSMIVKCRIAKLYIKHTFQTAIFTLVMTGRIKEQFSTFVALP